METELKFEKALEKLEKIVEDLEAGNIPLEDALRKYEEGVKLSRFCTEKLTHAETKIEQLTRVLNSAPESGEEKGFKKTAKRSKKTEIEPTEDDLLL